MGKFHLNSLKHLQCDVRIRSLQTPRGFYGLLIVTDSARGAIPSDLRISISRIEEEAVYSFNEPASPVLLRREPAPAQGRRPSEGA